jgi:hypothetical protein
MKIISEAEMKERNLTRREFIKAGSMAAAASAVLINSPLDLLAKQNTKTRVVLIRNQNVLSAEGKVVPEVIQQMLDDAVKVLFDTKDSLSAWEKILKPQDVVGIKTNMWKYLRTPVELEQAIKKCVMDVGVAEDKISINDRSILNDPVFQNATALINSRPMRTHYWSGVGSLLKNYIMFVPKPSDYHPDSCADLGAIWNLPNVKGKTKLNVLVMLTPLFHSVGPNGFSEDYVWKYNGLIVGVDPVACDSTGLRIIEAKRKEFFGEYRPLNPHAKHIEYADTRHHVGTADVNKIELIKLGSKEGILI